MALTKLDVAAKQVNGEIIELSDVDKQVIVDEWNAPDTRPYDEKRKSEYPSINELVVALWESVVEERMTSVTALEGLRQAIKTKYPKP